MPEKLKKILKVFLKVFIPLVLLGGIFVGLHYITFKSSTPPIYGTTFTYEYAQYLDLDPRQTFIKLLDDYKFRYIRIPVPWDMIEPDADGGYQFKDIDWLMDEAAKRHAHIILAIGEKTPRWPECHTPAWAKELPLDQQHTLLARSISATVTRYKNHSALEAWQVENEPYLPFGECPQLDESFFKQLIQQVRDFDGSKHPIMITDSGELSLWTRSGQVGDWFGTTLYRITWNKYLGYVNLNYIPASWYRLRLLWTKHEVENSFVIELQGEPWIENGSIMTISQEEKNKSLSLDQFKDNITFAEQIGFPRVYLWGAEWWIWMEERGGDKEFANFTKELRKE
jgi:hypothetical protein